MWEHETGIFAEYLYLRPFGADISYGAQQNGTGGGNFGVPPGGVPEGDIGVIAPQFRSGYRIGGELALSCTTGIRATLHRLRHFDDQHARPTQRRSIGSDRHSQLVHVHSRHAGVQQRQYDL